MPVAPGLVEPADLPLPHLPPSLEGLRIAHLSDLQVNRRSRRCDRLLHQLTNLSIDVIVLTGDYIEDEADEQFGFELLCRLCEQIRPSIGFFGVFGNHDTLGMRQRCASLPIHWLCNQAYRVPDRLIEVFGFDSGNIRGTDSVELVVNHAQFWDGSETSPDPRPLRLLLSHYPSAIATASDLGMDLMIAGHTHGGQWRLPTGHALVNSSDLPLRLSSGLLRHRNLLVAISRGLGAASPFRIPGFRLFCPPHVPLYTLHRRSLPGTYRDDIKSVWWW